MADVYLQNLFDMVRAKMAADPNQTINGTQSNGQEPRRDRSIAWYIDDSSELYQVSAWGKGYFCVNEAGQSKRPTKFGTSADDTFLIFEFEKVKK